MHNKIIKYALVLLATASSIFAWTQATEITNCDTIGSYTFNCNLYNPGETISYNGVYNTISTTTNFAVDYNNITYTAYMQKRTGYDRKYTFFWNNGKLHFMYTNEAGLTKIYEIQRTCKYEGTDTAGIITQCGNKAQYEGDGNPYINSGEYYTYIVNNNIQLRNILIENNIANNGEIRQTSPTLCLIYENNTTYCLDNNYVGNNNGYRSGPLIQQGNTNTPLEEYKNLFELSPITAGGGNGGGNTPITQYSCPTIQQLINTYGQQYNTGLCYSSTLIYTGGTIQTIEPKTIFELYPTYTGFTQAVNLYFNYCTPPATQETCNNAFRGNELGRTIINKLPSDAKNSSVYQYCNLQLNYEDKNATTCTLQQTGILAPGITINNIVNEIGNQDITVVTPGTPPEGEEGNGSGSVFDDLIGENTEETERRNIIENAKNIVQTMKELYAKFTGIFRGRSGTEGFIPEYITGMLLIIILYKLFKK